MQQFPFGVRVVRREMLRTRLEAVRACMRLAGVQAYIVPSSDPHLSEYVPPRDKRREWLSGFSGSAGTAVVTHTDALLWTDGRYFAQALQQLDASAGWRLMRDRLPETPSIEDWVAGALQPSERCGVDAALFPVSALRRMETALGKRGVALCAPERNLVDEVWGAAQPPRPDAAFFVHPDARAGEGVASKLVRVRGALAAAGADALAVTSLDDIAWLLNVRGSDVACCPVGLGYALVTHDGVTLAVDASKVTSPVAAHLAAAGVRLVPYEEAAAMLGACAGKVWLDPGSCNAALFAAIAAGADSVPVAGGGAPVLRLTSPPGRVLEKASPISLMKAVKNAAELQGMRAAHVRDALVLARFFAWLEAASERGVDTRLPGAPPLAFALTEFTAGAVLDAWRCAGPGCVSLSFETICGWRANGAVVHYRADEATAARIEGPGLLLVDSGGQYEDGTTDVTRVVCLGGDPTPHQRRAYTAVLQGHIALSRARFPSGTGGVALDALARAPLWAQGLDCA